MVTYCVYEIRNKICLIDGLFK